MRTLKLSEFSNADVKGTACGIKRRGFIAGIGRMPVLFLLNTGSQ